MHATVNIAQCCVTANRELKIVDLLHNAHSVAITDLWIV